MDNVEAPVLDAIKRSTPARIHYRRAGDDVVRAVVIVPVANCHYIAPGVASTLGFATDVKRRTISPALAPFLPQPSDGSSPVAC